MRRPSPRYLPLAATVLVMIGLYVFGCIRHESFSSLRVLVNLFGDNAYLGVAAVGATFVILSGGIDLSVGAVVAFTGIFIASALSRGMNPLWAMVIAVTIGVSFGALQGSLISIFDLPPFLVTLGGMFFMRGMGFVVHPQSVGIRHAFYGTTIPNLAIPLSQRLSVPFTALCLIGVVLAGTFLAVFTRFGRTIYAIGSNQTSAALMGVPVRRTKVGIYALAGLFSALGGIVATFYKQSGDPASFVGLELEAIAATVIGGTPLTGGVGFIPGTLTGVMILGLINNLVIFEGDLNSWWTSIAIGGLLLLSIVLQQAVGRRAAD